jgi:hypothetical protein
VVQATVLPANKSGASSRWSEKLCMIRIALLKPFIEAIIAAII